VPHSHLLLSEVAPRIVSETLNKERSNQNTMSILSNENA